MPGRVIKQVQYAGLPYSPSQYVRVLTREDCPICASRRDDLGRMSVGRCGPDCLMARIRRGEVLPHVVVG